MQFQIIFHMLESPLLKFEGTQNPYLRHRQAFIVSYFDLFYF